GPHAAMDIGVLRAVDAIQEPGCDRRTEKPVQFWHGARLDVSRKPAAHDEVVSLVELVNEGLDVAEVVGEIAVAHDDVVAADVRQSVDVGSAQASLRDL